MFAQSYVCTNLPNCVRVVQKYVHFVTSPLLRNEKFQFHKMLLGFASMQNGYFSAKIGDFSSNSPGI